MFQIHRHTQMRQPQIEVYVEFENVEADEIQNDLDIEDDRAAVYKGMNSDSEEDFEATYEAGDEDEDGDVGIEAATENVVVYPLGSQPMNIPPFLRNLDLDAKHALEFSEYENIGIADPEDGEFRIGMEYSSKNSVVATIRSYTISRGVDYNVYESEPQTFYAKCKTYGRGCDWLIRASLIRKKGCWEIRRYNSRYTCTMGMILQNHSKLDSDTVAEAIRPLLLVSVTVDGNLRWDQQKVKPLITGWNGKYGLTMLAGLTLVVVLRVVAVLIVPTVLTVPTMLTAMSVMTALAVVAGLDVVAGSTMVSVMATMTGDPVATVCNKETDQTLHAEVDLEVQVAVVLVADMDTKERALTISAYVRTSPHTNPSTPLSLHSAKSDAMMVQWNVSCYSRGRLCIPKLTHHSVRRVPFDTLE
ncbi:hypothetical protein Ahy_B06g081252 [Arachis hypogaea]|uniref:Transposase MuDR plant domain-containing protein n=1 Tax=Arachis hypogaea TaxID=3818 RepID=A0A444YKJ3_ARAHY|nr:hypothetical protein Ahy_B06g081252 [Arachis hypogaea]